MKLLKYYKIKILLCFKISLLELYFKNNVIIIEILNINHRIVSQYI